MSDLANWDGFYGIVGSAAGALIGLQFVVMTLVAERQRAPSPEAAAAYATPTIVHFCGVLLLSALLRAPWPAMILAAAAWGAAGLGGLVYTIAVARRIREQVAYQAAFEDWLFHVVLPLAAYSGLAASAFATLRHAAEALFGVAASALLLLFAGIHNAWDSAAYHVLVPHHADEPVRPPGRNSGENGPGVGPRHEPSR